MEEQNNTGAGQGVLAVIGGGPAGLLAAGRAAELGANVVLFDKNPEAGVNCSIGKGRAITQRGTHFQHSSRVRHGRTVFSTARKHLRPDHITGVLEARGRANVVEAKAGLPGIRSASDIRDALVRYAQEGACCSVRESPDLSIAEIPEGSGIVSREQRRARRRGHPSRPARQRIAYGIDRGRLPVRQEARHTIVEPGRRSLPSVSGNRGFSGQGLT
jgi:hypothetical protein